MFVSRLAENVDGVINAYSCYRFAQYVDQVLLEYY